MATDEEAYKTFSDLFGPIIKDLHPRFDFRYSYKFEEPTLSSFDKRLAEMEHYVERCESMQIRMNRNFRGMPFSPLMTKEAKLQIERKVVEVLGELYGQYHQINRIDDKTEDYLHTLGVNIHRTPLHDAAGINDDYPVGRGVFIEDSHEFIVLVNFEDHVEIVLLPEKYKKESLRRCLSRLAKLNQTFDKIGYATDAYLGHLTVSPSNLGTGMSMTATIRLDGSKMNPPNGGAQLKELLLEKLPNQRLIKLGVRSNANGYTNAVFVDISTTQTLAPNYYEIIQINDFLWAVETVAEFDVKGGGVPFGKMPNLPTNES